MRYTHPDFHWLVGMFEGEGTFIPGSPSQPRRCIAGIVSTDYDVIERCARLMGTTIITRKRKNAPDHWKDIYEARLRGGRAARFMREVRPYMSGRRQSAIDRALACVVDDPRLTDNVPVLDVMPAP